MPREVLADSAGMRAAAPVIGWYGKTPFAGDFVSRRLSRAIIDKLDAWLQQGMTAIRDEAPDVWQEYYESAPIWDAVLPAGIVTASACLAIVAASFDRVGRRFPFCLIVALPAHTGALARFASLPDYCASLSIAVDEAIRKSIGADELDRTLDALTSQSIRDETSDAAGFSDIAAVLGDAALGDETTVPLNADSLFPWPDLTRTFDPVGSISYWWGSVQRLRRHCGLTHSGDLNTTLFRTLFGMAINTADRTPPAG